MIDQVLNHKLHKKLHEIANILCNSLHIFNNPGVLAGVSGLALFMYYYSRFTGDSKYAEVGEKALERAVDMINEGFTDHSFCSGLSGFVWTCEHLERYKFIDRESIAFIEEFEPYLISCMEKEFSNKHYDFLYGGVGIGYYFLSKREKNNGDNKTLYLWLKDSAIRCADGSLKWESLIHNSEKTIINISLSHGMSSIIVILTKICNLYPKSVEARNILFCAIQYVLQQQLPNPVNSYFPTYSLERENNPQSSRLSWCYGDLGISQAIFQAARSLENKSIEDVAINILLHNCKRTKMIENGVMDAGICHGTSGICHIFNRLYVMTKIELFKEMSVFWLERSIAMDHFSDGLAGFKSWQGEKYGWNNQLSILDGIIGIGLCFLSQLNPDLINWDECLLLN